jgi:hypothetical protein
MAKAERPWIVTPHSPLQKLEENVWTVESRVPGTPMQRRMVIVKRTDGTLLFYQAIPLDEPTLAEVLAWGKPAILIVPHDQHGMDARAFAKKLGTKIYGPKRSEAKMRAKFDMTGTFEEIPADPAVTIESLDGSKNGEPVGIVRSPNGHVTLLFADAYMANPSETTAWPLRLAGFGGGPKVNMIFRLLFMSDGKALRAHLEKVASLPGLKHLVPCHGVVESADAAGLLRQVAATL